MGNWLAFVMNLVQQVGGTSWLGTELVLSTSDVAPLCRVTRGYFDSLVRDLETGLKSVDGKAAAEAGTSKSSRSKSKGGKGKGGSSRPKSNVLDEVAYWSCERCTYANPNASAACQMCASPRPA